MREITDKRKFFLLSLLPGLGHIYAGILWRGIGLLIAYFIALLIFMEPKNYANPPDAPMLAVVWLVVTALFWAYCMRDLRAEMKGREEEGKKKKKKK